jgi:hypothetical protein
MTFQSNAVDCGVYVMWIMWLFKTNTPLEPSLGTNAKLIRSFRTAFALDVLAHLSWKVSTVEL